MNTGSSAQIQIAQNYSETLIGSLVDTSDFIRA